MGTKIKACPIDEADNICKQIIKNLQAESSSKETFLINLSMLAGGTAGGPLATRLKMTKSEQGSACHYECCRKIKYSAMEGDLTIRATIEHATTPNLPQDEEDDSEESWKKKHLALKQVIRLRNEKVGRLLKGMLDALQHATESSGEKWNS